jgi:hypothetical protein
MVRKMNGDRYWSTLCEELDAPMPKKKENGVYLLLYYNLHAKELA